MWFALNNFLTKLNQNCLVINLPFSRFEINNLIRHVVNLEKYILDLSF